MCRHPFRCLLLLMGQRVQENWCKHEALETVFPRVTSSLSLIQNLLSSVPIHETVRNSPVRACTQSKTPGTSQFWTNHSKLYCLLITTVQVLTLYVHCVSNPSARPYLLIGFTNACITSQRWQNQVANFIVFLTQKCCLLQRYYTLLPVLNICPSLHTYLKISSLTKIL